MIVETLFTEQCTIEGFELRTVRITAPEIGLVFTSKVHCAIGTTLGPEFATETIEAALKNVGWGVERVSC